MVEESINTRFTKAGKLLAEIEKLADGGEWIVIGALHWCLSTKDIRQQCRVSDLLVRHKLNQEPILGGKTSGLEFFGREQGKTVVEEVELNPFLVKCKCLVISAKSSNEEPIDTY